MDNLRARYSTPTNHLSKFTVIASEILVPSLITQKTKEKIPVYFGVINGPMGIDNGILGQKLPEIVRQKFYRLMILRRVYLFKFIFMPPKGAKTQDEKLTGREILLNNYFTSDKEKKKVPKDVDPTVARVAKNFDLKPRSSKEIQILNNRDR